jgi:cytochrome c peroxidase
MAEKGNLRRHNRTQARSIVQIVWKDHLGNEKYTKARTLDVSQSGMRVEVPERIPERSYVTFRSDELSLQGTGSVRTCHGKGIKFVVGVEFSAGMKWQPKSEPAESTGEEVETHITSR